MAEKRALEISKKRQQNVPIAILMNFSQLCLIRYAAWTKSVQQNVRNITGTKYSKSTNLRTKGIYEFKNSQTLFHEFKDFQSFEFFQIKVLLSTTKYY